MDPYYLDLARQELRHVANEPDEYTVRTALENTAHCTAESIREALEVTKTVETDPTESENVRRKARIHREVIQFGLMLLEQPTIETEVQS